MDQSTQHDPYGPGHHPAARTKRPGSSVRAAGQPPPNQGPDQPRRRPGPINQAPPGLLRAVADTVRLNRLSDDGVAAAAQPTAVWPAAGESKVPDTAAGKQQHTQQNQGQFKPGAGSGVRRDVVGEKEAAALTALLMKNKPKSSQSPPKPGAAPSAAHHHSAPATASFHGPPKHSFSSSALGSRPSRDAATTPAHTARAAHVAPGSTPAHGGPSPHTATHVPYAAQRSPAGSVGAGAAAGGGGPASGTAIVTATPAGAAIGTAGKRTPTPAPPVIDPADEVPFPQNLQQLIGYVLDALVMEGDLPDRIPQQARTKAKKLKSGAHNAVQPLYIGFEEARLRLSVAHFISLQEFYREVESHCYACYVSLEEANEGNPAFDPHLRAYLLEMSQQYASEVISVCEELCEPKMGKSARRADASGGAAAQNKARAKASRAAVVEDGMPPLPGAGLNLPESVVNNTEPYFQGAWRREPFPPRLYRTLAEYDLHGPTPEEKQLLKLRLTTKRPDGASEHFRLEHSQLGSQLASVEAQLARAVHARDTLRLGSDVIEMDSWGLDMYTRKNVFDALHESRVFTNPDLVGPFLAAAAAPPIALPPDTTSTPPADLAAIPPPPATTPPPAAGLPASTPDTQLAGLSAAGDVPRHQDTQLAAAAGPSQAGPGQAGDEPRNTGPVPMEVEQVHDGSIAAGGGGAGAGVGAATTAGEASAGGAGCGEAGAGVAGDVEMKTEPATAEAAGVVAVDGDDQAVTGPGAGAAGDVEMKVEAGTAGDLPSAVSAMQLDPPPQASTPPPATATTPPRPTQPAAAAVPPSPPPAAQAPAAPAAPAAQAAVAVLPRLASATTTLPPSQHPLSPQVRARMAALERGGWNSPSKHGSDPAKRFAGVLAGQRLDFAAGSGAEGMGQEWQGSEDRETDAIHAWIDSKFLPAVNYAGLQGFNILNVCDTLRSTAIAKSDALSATCADVIEARVRQCGWPYFRLHPKGRGIQCTRPGGIPAYTFVEEYLGELYSPWRWWEVQDAIKKVTGEEELPDFYNITLERPKDDPDGYDMLYVEAAFKATFASRMSHSCTPNCQAVVVSAGGRLTIAMYTLRHIQEGEELTFDYNCVTESEKEFRSAICLCGTQSCRGSYLHFLGAKAFGLALEAHHTLLHRQTIILRASAETFTEADAARLREHGLGNLALGQALGDAPPCPTWLHKWTSLTLEYVELERSLLPDLLLQLPPPFNQYTQEYAEAQAQGVMSSRVSSIFVTLDKIKLFLRQAGQLQCPPLRILTEFEVLSHLWTSDRSMMHRLVLAAANQLGGPGVVASLGPPWTSGAPDAGITREELCRALEVLTSQGNRTPLMSMLTIATREVKSLYEARKGLLEAEAVLRMCEDPHGVHTAAADIIHLAACTVVWFTAERNYKGFTSPPVILNEETLKLHKSMSARATTSSSGAVTAPPPAPPPADDDSMDIGDDSSEAELARRRLETAAGTLSKRYGPWYIWGQLNAWYKQTVTDPCASLSAERRGTLSLPDVESCYNARGPRYNAKERAALLEHIEKRPDTQWKSTSSFTFKNEAKVYGSPMFDSVYLPKVLGTPASLPEVVKHLRNVPLPWPASSGTGRGPGRPRKDQSQQH